MMTWCSSVFPAAWAQLWFGAYTSVFGAILIFTALFVAWGALHRIAVAARSKASVKQRLVDVVVDR